MGGVDGAVKVFYFVKLSDACSVSPLVSVGGFYYPET